MPRVYGNSGDGGTSGANGGRIYVDYSISQNVALNRSTISYTVGFDYGNPNFWHNLSNGALSVGAITGTSPDNGTFIWEAPGFYFGTTQPPNPGGDNSLHSGSWQLTHNSSGVGRAAMFATTDANSGGYNSQIYWEFDLPTITQAPSAPTSVTATRINDGQVNVAWTNNQPTGAAYSSMRVERRTDGGSWTTVVATDFEIIGVSDTGVSANNRYEYRVVGINAAGSATSSISSSVYTTPGAPTSCTATKQVSGDIQITWSNNVSYGNTAYTTRIEHSTNNGSSWSELTSVSGGVANYTHVSPDPGDTHRYRVRARSNTGSLNSGYSTSANIVLLSTANAPSGLSVDQQSYTSSTARDADGSITLRWTHNPTDGTPQSKRRVQYKVDTGSFVDAVNDSSVVSSYTIPAETLDNGHTITWKVATAGENATPGR